MMKHTYTAVMIPVGERDQVISDLVNLGVYIFDSVNIVNNDQITKLDFRCNGSLISISVGKNLYQGDIDVLDRTLDGILLRSDLGAKKTLVVINALTHLRENKIANRYLIKQLYDSLKSRMKPRHIK